MFMFLEIAAMWGASVAYLVERIQHTLTRGTGAGVPTRDSIHHLMSLLNQGQKNQQHLNIFLKKMLKCSGNGWLHKSHLPYCHIIHKTTCCSLYAYCIFKPD